MAYSYNRKIKAVLVYPIQFSLLKLQNFIFNNVSYCINIQKGKDLISQDTNKLKFNNETTNFAKASHSFSSWNRLLYDMVSENGEKFTLLQFCNDNLQLSKHLVASKS